MYLSENKSNYNQIIKSLTISSDIHKQVRQHLIPNLKPGIKLVDIAKIIENKTIELSKGYDTINKGIGFPSSLALNNCTAHFHPKAKTKLGCFCTNYLRALYPFGYNALRLHSWNPFVPSGSTGFLQDPQKLLFIHFV
jgi:hypothetical protein